MDVTHRLKLPLLTAGQVQKEVYHNEALALLDLLVAGSLTAGPLTSPPASPAPGATYLIASAGAADAFAGKENHLAGWTAAGWRFVVPVEGMRLTVRSTGVASEYWNGQWRAGSVRGDELVIGGAKVVGTAAPAVAGPAGGATIDAEARACLAQMLAALRGHGLIRT